MTADRLAWRAGRTGLVVRVRLTPRASRDAIEGIEPTTDGPALKARVRAAPVDGKANAAVVRLLADWLGVAKSTVSLTSGDKSRVKMLEVAGDARDLAATAARQLAQHMTPGGGI